jgi:DNA-binding response OmpR family regulator
VGANQKAKQEETMRQILFADNDPDFLETRSEFLEKAGYKVVKATSPTDAERCLRDMWTPIAILDVRLVDDDDEKDLSGVTLAESDLCRSLTKVMLTNYPSPLLNALLAIEKGDRQQRMVAVLDKKDGYEVLLQTLEKAFKEYAHINFSLTPDWQATTPPDLAWHLEPELKEERERLLNRAEELEDLFRRLFYDWERIRIDRVLWQREGRVALTVFAFKDAAMDSFVVVCGENARVMAEAERWRTFAPKAQGETSTTLAHQAETTHFAANAYALARQADLETVRSLEEVYRAGDRKLFTQAVETLFEETLAAWQPGPPLPAAHALEELYRARLGLTAERIAPQAIRARWQKLVQYVPELKTNVPDPEPIVALLQAATTEQPTLKIKSPGTLTGDDILVDANGRAWLTDFADAGDVPQFWNFVALESAIRFDWLEERELMRLQEVEKCLLDDDRFSKLGPEGIESVAARQAVRFIQPIRRLAARAVGKEYWQYHLGIFFHAARRLADFDPAVPPMLNQRARLVHALLAMAQIAAKIGQREREVMVKGERGLRVDEDGVKRDGKRISVRGQSLDLLMYLASPPNQLRTQRDIIENVLKEQFDAHDKTQITRLHAAVRRLREKIEYDADHPRYLLTESNGYRLVLQPDD